MDTPTDAHAILAGGSDGNSGPDRAAHPETNEDGGLGLPTAELMAQGGDARITLDEASGLNSYGCAPKPLPEISYASSTASTVSAGAFAQARAFHFQLKAQAEATPVAQLYAEAMEAARLRLRGLYGLGSSVDVAFGPSGTDLEYLILALSMRGGRIVRNIVVEVDEVGSGCLNAQQGRYFAPHTALGLDVETGVAVPGFSPERILVETIPTRSGEGELRSPEEREALLAEAIERSLAAGERPLLHTVHRSKTGLIAPAPAVLDRLLARFGDAFDIIVDACQGRISPEMIRAYLVQGAAVFVTGSKFIGGPPFSAFAFVPPRLAGRMTDETPAPEGLGGFFARGEMPRSWRSMDGVLREIPNFGLLLRLECGLFELGRLLAYPAQVASDAIGAFAQAVHDLPADAPFELLPADESVDERGLPPLDRTMLHTLRLTAPHPRTGGPLDIDDARAIYASLYTDISDHFTDPHERMVAAETVHVGQPVRCRRLPDGRWAATLRVSLSAPHISQTAGLGPEALRRRFEADMAWIAAKIRLALRLLPPRG